MYLPSTLPYGSDKREFPFSCCGSLEEHPWDRTLQPSKFHQQGEGSSMLIVIPRHRAHMQEVFLDRSTFGENFFHLVFWTALNTKGISAGDSRCYLIWIKNNNDVYQSNEAFRWNALHQCNLLWEFSLFYKQACKPPLKKSDKWCSSCRWSASSFTMKAPYYLKTLTAIW